MDICWFFNCLPAQLTAQFNQPTPNSTVNFMRSILLTENLELFEVEDKYLDLGTTMKKVRIDYPCSSQEIQGWRVNALLIDDHEVFVASSTNLHAKKTWRMKPYTSILKSWALVTKQITLFFNSMIRLTRSSTWRLSAATIFSLWSAFE